MVPVPVCGWQAELQAIGTFNFFYFHGMCLIWSPCAFQIGAKNFASNFVSLSRNSQRNRNFVSKICLLMHLFCNKMQFFIFEFCNEMRFFKIQTKFDHSKNAKILTHNAKFWVQRLTKKHGVLTKVLNKAPLDGSLEIKISLFMQSWCRLLIFFKKLCNEVLR